MVIVLYGGLTQTGRSALGLMPLQLTGCRHAHAESALAQPQAITKGLHTVVEPTPDIQAGQPALSHLTLLTNRRRY